MMRSLLLPWSMRVKKRISEHVTLRWNTSEINISLAALLSVPLVEARLRVTSEISKIVSRLLAALVGLCGGVVLKFVGVVIVERH